MDPALSCQLRGRMLSSMLGGIVGDAYGSPYQFQARDTFTVTAELEPCENFSTPPGAYTDDSAMMLCLARSLTKRVGHDAGDQMHRYWRWIQTGYMSSMPWAFDLGGTTIHSIDGYAADLARMAEGKRRQRTRYGLSAERNSGNGGIMRLAPAPIFYWRDGEEAVWYSRAASAVTHASPECLDCAALMGHVLHKLLNGASREEALDNEGFEARVSCPKVATLCRSEYKLKGRADISTSGYVVHTLEAALWALATCDDYRSGVMTLAAMGDDADTTCCVYGQLAGALWGEAAIPPAWLEGLQRRELVMGVITELADLALI